MRFSRVIVLCLFLFLSGVAAFSQQDYVSRYDAFGSYSFLSTPKLNLFERGFNGQFGVNVRHWLAIGGDFSTFSGHSSLFPSQLAPAKQMQLAQGLAQLGGLPPGYTLYAPYNTTTYTFTAGPQFGYRHFKQVTLFIRPSIGGLHQSATARPIDPIQTVVVTGLLGPSMKKSDLVLFYGFGGGFDLNVQKHVAIRMAADFVHTDLFSGLLNGGENNVRFSVGPAFRWGRNVER